MTKGRPNLRLEFIRGRVWAKTPEQLRRDVVPGRSPVSGKPVMQEIVETLTTSSGMEGISVSDNDFVKNIFYDQDTSLLGAAAILSPPIANFVKDAGYATVESFTKWLRQPPEGQKPHSRDANQTNIVVTGGSNNNYYSIGGLAYTRSLQIDKWL